MKKKKKNGKKKKKYSGLTDTLNLYYAVSALITAVLILYLGVSTAGRYSERNMNGSFPTLVYYEDVKNVLSGFLKDLSD